MDQNVLQNVKLFYKKVLHRTLIEDEDNLLVPLLQKLEEVAIKLTIIRILGDGVMGSFELTIIKKILKS